MYIIKNFFIILFYYIKIIIKINNKKIFLIGTPWHGNIGDQALVIAEKYILNNICERGKVIEVPSMVYNSIWKKFFGLGIKNDDIIFLQGGGNLGTIYINEENFHRDVVTRYPKNKVIIMPMSIFFHDDEFGRRELEKSMSIYNKHRDFTIISRDEASYNFARKYFYNVNNILAPDTVITLETLVSKQTFERKGVCFFLRADIEKVVKDEVIDTIKSSLEEKRINYILSDTADNNSYRTDKERKKIIFSRWLLAQKSRMVITDRYHGVIFAVITKTPVIVFKSFDTKISSGIKWFKDLNWVHYVDANNLKDIKYLIDKYCLLEECKIELTNKYKSLIVKTIKDIIIKK